MHKFAQLGLTQDIFSPELLLRFKKVTDLMVCKKKTKDEKSRKEKENQEYRKIGRKIRYLFSFHLKFATFYKTSPFSPKKAGKP